jgi:acylphosphatase
MATVSKRVIYSGRVQGVGFRATARWLADGFPVSGYVRNLPGGQVELVAEGEPGAVGPFLEAVRQQFAANITDVDVRDEPPAGHHGFQVRH